MKHKPSGQVRQWERVGAFVLGCCLLIAAAVVDGYRQALGFPDGFLSPFERAEQVLATVFVAGSLLVSVWLGVLSWRALTQPIKRQLRATLVVYGVCVLLLLLIGLVLRLQLDAGAGG